MLFKKEDLLNAWVNNELESKVTRDGKFIQVPDRWAKEHAFEVISYKYTR